jgi:hypothetical protein
MNEYEWLTAGMLSWFQRVCIVTRAPASRHTRAVAGSRGDQERDSTDRYVRLRVMEV